MINPAPAPEGVLDPQQPWWPTANMRDSSWDILKAKLTGRRMPDGTQYETWVHLTSGDADRLIANIKKYGKYPQVNQTGGQGGYEHLLAYQNWLVEEFLEKPFRDETNAKIEEAEQAARIEELRKQAERDKQTVIIKNKKVPLANVYKEAEQKQEEKNPEAEDKKEEEEARKEVEDYADKVDQESEKQDKQEAEPQQEAQEPQAAPKEEDSDDQETAELNEISDALANIKASLNSQTSIVEGINKTGLGSVSTIEAIKGLLSSQKAMLQQQIEAAAEKKNEASLEKDAGQEQAGAVKSTSTTEKPPEEKGGGGFLGKAFNIAKGFVGKKMGGGGMPPVKLAGGGFLNTPFPATNSFSDGGIGMYPSIGLPATQSYAKGVIQPGVYNKPTRGNLMPGQAVIPLNRNVGKNLKGGKQDENSKKSEKFHQPLADVMQQPVKAIGAAIVAMAGNFIRALGPIAGFFVPFVKSLVGPMAIALGVGTTIIDALLGGPAFAATTDAKRQQDIFSSIWASLMGKFDIFNLFKGKDNKDQTNNTTSTSPADGNFKGSEGGEKTMNYFMSQGLSPQQAAGVAGNLMQESHFDPNADNGTHHGIAQWDKQDRWPKVSNYITSIGKDPNSLEGQLIGLKWEADKRGDWKQIQQTKTAQDAALKWLQRFEISGEKPGSPGFDNRMSNANNLLSKYGKVSAEVGANTSQGNPVDAFTIAGPNSGYEVPGVGTMHGKEAFIQYEKGFTILPIENRKFSMESDPLRTMMQWEKILTGKSKPATEKYESGGAISMTANWLKKYEGYRDDAYWDVNHYRVGYGSDTQTKADGSVVPVTKGYKTNKEDANRDLERRVKGFLSNAEKQIGGKWGSLDDSTKAALGSIAYNYGHVPGSIVTAAQTGDKEAIAKAIEARKSDDGGVNSSRRQAEANLVRGKESVSSDGTSSGGQSDQPKDPFQAMEDAIKAMSVSIGLLAATSQGQVKDEASYKALQTSLSTATASTPDSGAAPPPPSNPAPAPVSHPAAHQTPANAPTIMPTDNRRTTTHQVIAQAAARNHG